MSQIKWKLIQWGVGFLSLYLDWRLRKKRPRRALDIFLIDYLVSRLIAKPNVEPFSEGERQTYLETTRQTIYWHGTGRWQYDRQGKAVDVLRQVLRQGGMRPFKDIFDVRQGEMVSTSVARQRMYARIYADMHEYGGANLRERYGSPRFWAYYFIMAINLHAIKELGLWNPKVRREQQATWRKQGMETWAVKAHRNPGIAIGKFFDNGSDIPDNYPILIGIRRADYTLVKTADYVARYEGRIGSNISIEIFTHLEVPANKKAEVAALFMKYGHQKLPIFTFEQCEQLHAQKHFSELVSQTA